MSMSLGMCMRTSNNSSLDRVWCTRARNGITARFVHVWNVSNVNVYVCVYIVGVHACMYILHVCMNVSLFVCLHVCTHSS